MKTGAIICFILAGLSLLRPLIVIPAMIMNPKNTNGIEVMVPMAVGMLLMPAIFLILGLIFWKKERLGSRSRRD